MFRKVKISLQTFIEVSENYYAWPALNFKSQFICNSFGIRTPSEGIWSSFHFHSAPPEKKSKKSSPQTSESLLQTFRGFFFFLFFPFASHRSLPRWEMSLEMIWETAWFLSLSSKIHPPKDSFEPSLGVRGYSHLGAYPATSKAGPRLAHCVGKGSRPGLLRWRASLTRVETEKDVL